MKRFFSYKEFELFHYLGLNEDKKVLNKTKEEDDSTIKIIKKNKDENGEKQIDKSNIPKDIVVKGLAKDLYDAQLKVFTIQNETDELINKLTKENPDNPEIATLTATAAVQVANAQLRADTIEQQMMAAGSISPNLTQVASELAAEAKNLAMKKGFEIFDKRLKKIKDDDKESSDK